MPDPNFESLSNPGPLVFGGLGANPPGAKKKLQPGIAEQLGQVPDAPDNQDVATLRDFVPKDYGIENLDLTNARADVLFEFDKLQSFIWIPNSTNTDDVILVRFNNPGAGQVPLLPGSKLSGIPFNRLYVSNAAIAAATMTVMVAQNWPEDRIDTDS